MAQLFLEGTWEEITADSITDIPRVGPPNDGMQTALCEIKERQVGRRQTLGDSVAIVRDGRSGPMYGMEPHRPD